MRNGARIGRSEVAAREFYRRSRARLAMQLGRRQAVDG
jgi:hypothetical protein